MCPLLVPDYLGIFHWSKGHKRQWSPLECLYSVGILYGVSIFYDQTFVSGSFPFVLHAPPTFNLNTLVISEENESRNSHHAIIFILLLYLSWFQVFSSAPCFFGHWSCNVQEQINLRSVTITMLLQFTGSEAWSSVLHWNLIFQGLKTLNNGMGLVAVPRERIAVPAIEKY